MPDTNTSLAIIAAILFGGLCCLPAASFAVGATYVGVVAVLEAIRNVEQARRRYDQKG